ncbi:MAG: CvpA family protein [Pseudomonadota bacterium]|nr:MAG: CvpA family protein [Pseudomonadota bacterium]
MNGFDIALLVVLAASAAFGAWRGFVREIMSLVSWVLAAVIAWVFADDMGGWFTSLSSEPALRQALAFVVLFVGVLILGAITSFIVHRAFVKGDFARWPNRLLGSAFGIGRGVVIITLVFLLAGLTALPQQSWWRGAALVPAFESVALFVSKYLPSDVARHIRYG